ncbi:Ncc69 [Bugula neritina]|uniref:Ncc69 n=1 Tax=Bugula neritina TaxID=10212 RepID=A0A7J7KAU4_BUGNE|nr:Ncc69 [Bugula neritina]
MFPCVMLKGRSELLHASVPLMCLYTAIHLQGCLFKERCSMFYILLATSKSQKQALTTAAAQSKKDVTDEGAEEEDVEFDPDEVAMTTFIGSKRLQRNKVPEVNRFHQKQKKGTIDVWWLFDDGGLTLLIPYILSTKLYWQDCKLRVFLAGTKKGELNKERKNMATLLSKFRIEYHDMEVIPSFGKAPSKNSEQIFKATVEPFRKHSTGSNSVDNNMIISDEALVDNKDRTNRHLRTRDLVCEKSSAAALIVMTLPVPRKGLPAPLYMAWLDCLTKNLPAPVLLLRGNQESVMTFYS